VGLKWLSWTAFLSLVVVAVILTAQDSIFAHDPIGIAAQIMAALLMLWVRLTFGIRSFHAGANPTAGGLVTTGPYRFLRHPIYASILMFILAAAQSHLTWLNFCLALVATAAVAVRIVAEERFLVKQYPEYRAYAARTRRIVPFLL